MALPAGVITRYMNFAVSGRAVRTALSILSVGGGFSSADPYNTYGGPTQDLTCPSPPNRRGAPCYPRPADFNACNGGTQSGTDPVDPATGEQQEMAQNLEEMEEVVHYVKNQNMGF